MRLLFTIHCSLLPDLRIYKISAKMKRTSPGGAYLPAGRELVDAQDLPSTTLDAGYPKPYVVWGKTTIVCTTYTFYIVNNINGHM